MSTVTLPRNGSVSESLLSDRQYREWRPSDSRRPDPTIPLAAESGGQLSLQFGDMSVDIQPAPADWIVPLIEKVCELGSLPPNWNSYSAHPIQHETAAEAITLLLNYLSPDDPLPSIVPTARGGIMLEWHVSGIDFEIDIRSPSWIQVSFDDGEEEEEFDHVERTMGIVEEKLRRLRSR